MPGYYRYDSTGGEGSCVKAQRVTNLDPGGYLKTDPRIRPRHTHRAQPVFIPGYRGTRVLELLSDIYHTVRTQYRTFHDIVSMPGIDTLFVDIFFQTHDAT